MCGNQEQIRLIEARAHLYCTVLDWLPTVLGLFTSRDLSEHLAHKLYHQLG
jgi:hypothetical protein